jgi:hypothetical protein
MRRPVNCIAGNVIFVSSRVVANQNAQFEFTNAFLVRDAAGHAIEIEQK